MGTIWDIFGYIGTVIVLYSFTIEDIKWLRFINSIGCLFWIVYGIGISAPPTIIVNGCILIIHTIWFIKGGFKIDEVWIDRIWTLVIISLIFIFFYFASKI